MTFRRVAGCAGELLVTLGVLLLLFAAWQLWWTDVVSLRESHALVRTFERDADRDPSPVRADGLPAGIREGDAFAVVRSPRFGDDYARPVLQGTGRDVPT